MNARLILTPLLMMMLARACPALAQDKGTVAAKPLPPLANPNDPKIGAKQLFARKLLPSSGPPKVIGAYNKGCVAGAAQMPRNGDTWQVMRLSRNRYWGYPGTIALLKRLATNVHKDTGWPGILVGDIGQPRGGPALSGHASHQIGLDADIWLTPMPDHRLSRDAAQEPGVQRIFVNAAIKKALCREATGDRSWLAKIRPWYGHDYHFHIRMRCPPGSSECKGQSDQGGGEGCNASDLAYWL